MSDYLIEIKKWENAKLIYSQLTDAQLLEIVHEFSGSTLIELQKTEFLIHGFVANFNTSILASDKNFKELSHRSFLNSYEKSKKTRKQTLGTVIKFLTGKTDVFDEKELNDYVQLRNQFIHSFARDFLSNSKADKREGLYLAIEFLLEVNRHDKKWHCIFKGLFYSLLKHFSKITGREIPISTQKEFKDYEVDFINYISK